MVLPERLDDAARSFLAELGPLLDQADREQRIAARSRRLCACLGVLAQATCRSVGEGSRAQEVGVAAAALSLLTKLDDEVIDSRRFHGGWQTERLSVRRRTERFLAPTLRSIATAEPATSEPRCLLAAEVGRRLRQLSSIGASAGPATGSGDAEGAGHARSADRYRRLLAMIAKGWSIQVDAVAVLTSHPREVSAATVATVTRSISGAWLTMVSLVGTLPSDAGALTDDEIEAVFDWGAHIQRADALADLEKDHADGLLSTVVLKALWDDHRIDPAHVGTEELYRYVAKHGVDVRLEPHAADRMLLERRLRRLPELHALLVWIDRMLLERYRAHRWCRAGATPGGRSLLPSAALAVARPGGGDEEGVRCSAR